MPNLRPNAQLVTYGVRGVIEMPFCMYIFVQVYGNEWEFFNTYSSRTREFINNDDNNRPKCGAFMDSTSKPPPQNFTGRK